MILAKKAARVSAVVLAVPLVLWGMIFTLSIANAAAVNHKYFVCKYVGKPGLDEKLQTGNNPISVDEHALTNPVVGAYFNDAQGRSLVVAEDTGQPDPTCPTPQNNPCQYDATILATDPKCVKPQDPVDPTPTNDPVPDPVVPTADGGMKDTVTGEVFYGK